MNNNADNSTHVFKIDQQIAELKQRLDCLRDLMLDMVERGENTGSQSELFCLLICTIKTLKAIRSNLVQQETKPR
jgi:hypothetical protein